MKKSFITLFAICFISLGSLLFGLPFGNSSSEAMYNNGNKGGTSFSDTKSGQPNKGPIVFNDSIEEVLKQFNKIF
jgi:hypothetical protein